MHISETACVFLKAGSGSDEQVRQRPAKCTNTLQASYILMVIPSFTHRKPAWTVSRIVNVPHEDIALHPWLVILAQLRQLSRNHSRRIVDRPSLSGPMCARSPFKLSTGFGSLRQRKKMEEIGPNGLTGIVMQVGLDDSLACWASMSQRDP